MTNTEENHAVVTEEADREKLAEIFESIRQLLATRAREIAAIERADELLRIEPLGFGSSIERLVPMARLDEVTELATRISVLAYERYGQALTLEFPPDRPAPTGDRT
jgi:hypothetical protein